MIRLVISFFCFFCLSFYAWADYQSGRDAFDQEDYEGAFNIWSKAASDGDPRSQYAVGLFYKTGLIVERDLVLAYKWFSLAADQGSVPAAKAKDDIAKTMSPEELARAEPTLPKTTEGQGSETLAPETPEETEGSAASEMSTSSAPRLEADRKKQANKIAAEEANLKAAQRVAEEQKDPSNQPREGLFVAVGQNDVIAIEQILDDGFDVNSTNTDGSTALIVAAAVGSDDAARLLLSRGARTDVRDASGKTAEQIAVETDHVQIANQIRAVEQARLKRKKTVLSAQELLSELGYDPGPVDGLYGSKTASAVMSFQEDQGLNRDGKVNKDLLSLLANEKQRRIDAAAHPELEDRELWSLESITESVLDMLSIDHMDQAEIDAYCDKFPDGALFDFESKKYISCVNRR